jgi:hypothetical protein
MPGHKRKREEVEDDDLSFQKQILPVADLPDNFDAPPMDGMQYLFMVRWVACSFCYAIKLTSL